MTDQGILYSTLAFRRIPTTVLLVLIYGLLFLGVFISDPVQKIPADRKGLDLEEALADLYQITRQPHPLNSRANELTRAYILDRVRNVTNGIAHAEVVDDLQSSASYARDVHATSFEGSNILVKLTGTDPEFADKGGVLFSAHFDSVSTAPGVTDDAIGISALVSFIKYLATHRTQRTAVFNLNNGEEDGLNGAHVFFEHPWSNITDTFLNLEGAAAGGRPLLFRATSTAPVRAFKNSGLSHPHGNVLSADAFARGVVASGTDFTVYNKGADPSRLGMEGIDYAFYQGRSKYHTKYDSLPGANGAKESLWAMMEGVRGAGLALLNEGSTHVGSGQSEAPVYFDLFGTSFIVFTQHSLFAFNVAMLVLGPLIVFILYRLPSIFSRLKGSDGDNKQGKVRIIVSTIFSRDRPSANHESVWIQLRELRWTKAAWWKECYTNIKTRSPGWRKRNWRWTKFWILFIICVLMQIILVVTFVSANPFAVHSQPFIVFGSMLSLTYLLTIFVMHMPFRPGGTRHPDQEKLTILLQTYILSWILAVLATLALSLLQIGGVYFLTAWNLFLFLGCVTGLVERILRHRKTTATSRAKTPVDDEGHRLDSPRKSGSIREQEHADAGPSSPPALLKNQPSLASTSKPTERTPLMAKRRRNLHVEEQSGAVGWWIPQVLLVVPIPVILFLHILVLFVQSLNQTLSDGSSPIVVYGGMGLFSVFIILPLAPFSFKIHRWLTSVIVLVFLITTIYSWAAFPFSQDAPMKVFFQQRVTFDLANPEAAPVAFSTLTGASRFITSHVLPAIPSTWESKAECKPSAFNSATRLSTCGWVTSFWPLPFANATTPPTPSTWFTANTTRLSSTSARISIRGVNTKSCRAYFDHPINGFSIISSSGSPTSPLQKAYPIPDGGIYSVWMYSREFDQTFTAEVSWKENSTLAEPGSMSGRVGCNWAEYESATLGLGLERNTTGIIPAYEEILTYLPKWTVASKLSEGLAEVYGTFKL